MWSVLISKPTSLRLQISPHKARTHPQPNNHPPHNQTALRRHKMAPTMICHSDEYFAESTPTGWLGKALEPKVTSVYHTQVDK